MGLQLVAAVVILAGDSLCEMFKIAPPAGMQALWENRFGVLVGVWFLGNIATNAFSNTGAFEIAYDGKMVFSKLSSSRMPAFDDIVSGIDGIMRSRANSM
jgi:hypothetical protein